jgi:hypothetical protein
MIVARSELGGAIAAQLPFGAWFHPLRRHSEFELLAPHISKSSRAMRCLASNGRDFFALTEP